MLVRLPRASLLGSRVVSRVGLSSPHLAVCTRWSSSAQDPAAAKPPNRHREFYKQFALPWTKVFLGAFFTYQVLYWGWLKLESIEMKEEKDEEIKGLEDKIRELTTKKMSKG